VRLLVAGASGFLGANLVEALRTRGDEVVTLVRRPARSAGEVTWDPAAGVLDPAVVRDADVVVNLAGSPTLGNPHSGKWARTMRESRISTTRLLAETIARQDRPPAFLAQNGLAWYGDHGTEVVTEDSDSRGDAFMTGLTRDWQDAATPAIEAGARVCILRTVPILDRSSAPMKQLIPLFKLGLGARLGSGGQYFPVISLRDWVGAVVHLCDHATVAGPVNICAPVTPTNREFTAALASALHRKAFLAAPSFVLGPAAGRLAPELLGSVNTRPDVLEDSGFAFADRDVDDVVAAALR
jgi:hypothetical protein